jgi:(E)-4-hydroxy-3-methylbut-2-enyl-diphosphate synthase
MTTTDPRPAQLTESDKATGDGRLAYCPSPFAYNRRRTHVVMVGDVGVGGDNPIRVQSMTTTRTLDTEATVAQAERLVKVGCEIVRITAPTVKDARNLAEIKRQLRAKGIGVPLVADIHFSPDAAFEAAEHVEKVRINPGNYADGRKFAVRSYTDAEYEAELVRIEERFAPLVMKCKERKISMRIGTNHGSLSDRIVNRFGDTPEGMVESALEFVRICEKYGYYDVILSMKASNPKVMIAAYRLLAARMAEVGMTYPFHLGVTEAGNGVDGRIKSTIGIGSLLADGIGDTIRVSLTEEPEEEVPVAFLIANYFTPRNPTPAPPPPRGEGDRTNLTPRPSPGAPGEGRKGEGEGPSPDTRYPTSDTSWDPFHYARRSSRAVQIGPVAVGGDAPVAVIARVGAEGELRLLRWASPGARRMRRPDVVDWPIADAESAAALRNARARLDRARDLTLLGADGATGLPKLALLASGSDAARLQEALPYADGVLLTTTDPNAVESVARATREAGKPLWIEAQGNADAAGDVRPSPLPLGEAAHGRVRESLRMGQTQQLSIDEDSLSLTLSLWEREQYAVQQLLDAYATSARAGQTDVVLSLTADSPEDLIWAQRLLVARLAHDGIDCPILLRSRPSAEHLLTAALPLGSLLCDGMGDAIQAATPGAGQDEVELTLDVLQGAGTRLSKTDYVACPSCGRTLFDLQTTTDRIKSKTSHLVGVKIAIMGCVVNGPGEMADADFGYVGGSPGHVNLYVGKTVVERNVPADVADDKLIELIKTRGRWQEPEPIGAAE